MVEAPIQVLNPWSVLTATGALVAFHIGLYTLIGRERKSPYIINSIFPILISCLAIAAIVLFSIIIPEPYSKFAIYIGIGGLALSFLASVIQVLKVAVRFRYFVDRLHIKDMPIVRHYRRWRLISTPDPNYQHNTIPIDDNITKKIEASVNKYGGESAQSRVELGNKSLAVSIEHQGQANKLLCDLSNVFLTENYTIQYLVASRHPIEFIEFLKNNLGSGLHWNEMAKRIIVIDAYSPHFAFLDSIYPRKHRDLRALGVKCVMSKRTFAGMHSASSRAFNELQKTVGETRKPTLVIYEDAYALADLESPEQYRIFVRHVMPSERLWDGMFTVFVEASQPDYDWRVLQAYASMRLDLRPSAAAQK